MISRSPKVHEFVLDDGRSARIRALRPSDRETYADAVAALSPHSRYLRFAAPLPKLGERQLDQLMQSDWDHVAYAAMTPDESVGLGVARYVRSTENPRSAEVAIAIADDWQGHGLGRELLGRLLEHARTAGLQTLVATSLSENRVAQRLLRSAGFGVVAREGIYTEYELTLER